MSVTASGLTPVCAKDCIRTPPTFGPRPVSSKTTLPGVFTSKASTLRVILSVGSPAFFKTSATFSRPASVPKNLASLGRTLSMSRRAKILNSPTAKAAVAGGAATGAAQADVAASAAANTTGANLRNDISATPQVFFVRGHLVDLIRDKGGIRDARP